MVRQSEIRLHGLQVSYRIGGRGPLLVLLHGITNSSATWEPVLGLLEQHFTVIAPDLLGHGDSAKPRGDYSLGANASLLRDLMLALGHESATIAGHSLGGGIAMQIAYQFPERVQRLVLVSSGGLGRQVTPLLRAAALPAAEFVLPLLTAKPLVSAGARVGGWMRQIGLGVGSDIAAMATGFASLQDIEARRAFVHTARAVIEIGGQRVSATDKLYLAEDVPTLILWGDRDTIIPVRHGIRAHGNISHSQLRIFAGAGHFPHHDDPAGFAAAITDFVATTKPPAPDEDRLRRLVIEHGADAA